MDASDALAIALVVCGLALYLERDRPGRLAWAAAAFAAAALTKEITLLAPAALAVAAVARRRDWRTAATIVGPGAIATAAWAVYVRARLGWPSTKVEELTGPLRGFFDAYRKGWRPFGDWGHMAVAIGMGLVCVAVVAAGVRDRRSDVLVAALPFALLFPFLSAQVLDLSVNSVRAAGPALTLLAIGATATRPPREARS
jgi:hypothetical protein